MYWCTSGYYPQGVFVACIIELCSLLVRVAHWRGRYSSLYATWQLDSAFILAVAIYLVFFYYVFCVSLYFRMIATAVEKLWRYISSYTFHKNPSLHLVCILMPPLVKEILESATGHSKSPNFKRESNAKRVVSAAYQVVRTYVCIGKLICIVFAADFKQYYLHVHFVYAIEL